MMSVECVAWKHVTRHTSHVTRHKPRLTSKCFLPPLSLFGADKFIHTPVL